MLFIKIVWDVLLYVYNLDNLLVIIGKNRIIENFFEIMFIEYVDLLNYFGSFFSVKDIVILLIIKYYGNLL